MKMKKHWTLQKMQWAAAVVVRPLWMFAEYENRWFFSLEHLFIAICVACVASPFSAISLPQQRGLWREWNPIQGMEVEWDKLRTHGLRVIIETQKVNGEKTNIQSYLVLFFIWKEVFPHSRHHQLVSMWYLLGSVCLSVLSTEFGANSYLKCLEMTLNELALKIKQIYRLNTWILFLFSFLSTVSLRVGNKRVCSL